MKRTALIMAGGRGERFWPKSRRRLPKQFLALTDDSRTMLQLTAERILPLVAWEDLFVVTNTDYLPLVREQLPLLPEENILCEPASRNTAPCIGLGAVHIEKKYGDAVMLVLPSDHLIKHRAVFLSTLRTACRIAESGDTLVTLGITPDYPETGYGYIRYSPEETTDGAFRVEQFVEKPDLETAKRYLSSGQYLWNSGMFIWKCSSILKALERHAPDIHAGLREIGAAVGTQRENETLYSRFPALRAESIDYAVMEKADNLHILAGAFGWDDVGSWLALERIRKSDADGNVLSGQVIAVGSKRCILQGGDKLIAAVGLRDVIAIDTPDALLLCDKAHAGEIRQVLERLQREKLTAYL